MSGVCTLNQNLKRALYIVSLCLISTIVSAVDKGVERSSGTKSQSVREIETTLASPANLEPLSRITFRELLTLLQKEHSITVKVERNFALVFGMIFEELLVTDSMTAEQIAQRLRAESNTVTAVADSHFVQVPGLAPPYGLSQGQPTYSYPAAQPATSVPVPTYESPPTAQPAIEPASHPTVTFKPPVTAETNAEKSATNESLSPQERSDKKRRTRPASANRVNPVAEDSAQKSKVAKLAKEKSTKSDSEEDKPAEKKEGLEDDPAETIHIVTKLTETFLKTEVSLDGFNLKDASVENVLRHAASQILTPMDMLSMEEMGMPLPVTRAYDIDLLVMDGSVQITTRLNANLHKETRVYKVSQFKDFEEVELSQVIRKTIRPWSWRSQVDDLIGQVTANWPTDIDIPEMNIDLTGEGSPIQLKTNENGKAAQPEKLAEQSAKNSRVAGEAMNAMSSLLSSGTIAFVHTMISGTEMIHYADPPTGVIETLPGMLVITHSQATHREIADLLSQLNDQLQ